VPDIWGRQGEWGWGWEGWKEDILPLVRISETIISISPWKICVSSNVKSSKSELYLREGSSEYLIQEFAQQFLWCNIKTRYHAFTFKSNLRAGQSRGVQLFVE